MLQPINQYESDPVYMYDALYLALRNVRAQVSSKYQYIIDTYIQILDQNTDRDSRSPYVTLSDLTYGLTKLRANYQQPQDVAFIDQLHSLWS